MLIESEDIGDPFVIENVDQSLSDDTVLKYGEDHTISYGNLKNILPINKQNETAAIVIWDDIMQFTSIGLMQALNSLYKLSVPMDIPHFFTRTNKYTYGIDYVYEKFSEHLTKEQIDGVKKKYYWKILQISLKSAMFRAITSINTFFRRLTFVFPCDFPELNLLERALAESFKSNSSLKFNCIVCKNNQELTDHIVDNNYNSIIGPDVDFIYNMILDKKMTKISIIAPNEHNNLTDEQYDLISKLKYAPLPNYCSIDLYKEEVLL